MAGEQSNKKFKVAKQKGYFDKDFYCLGFLLLKRTVNTTLKYIAIKELRVKNGQKVLAKNH